MSLATGPAGEHHLMASRNARRALVGTVLSVISLMRYFRTQGAVE
jgi:hypothetical protein